MELLPKSNAKLIKFEEKTHILVDQPATKFHKSPRNRSKLEIRKYTHPSVKIIDAPIPTLDNPREKNAFLAKKQLKRKQSLKKSEA
jgi:hypothetical protein